MSKNQAARIVVGVFMVGFLFFLISSIKKRPETSLSFPKLTDSNARLEASGIIIETVRPETITVIKATKIYEYDDQIVRLNNTTIDQEGSDENKTPEWHAEAPTVRYLKDKNLLELEGSENRKEDRPLVIYGNERVLADKIIVRISKTSELQSMEAIGNVTWQSFENCREATGEKLTVNFKDNSFILESQNQVTKITIIKGCQNPNKKEASSTSFMLSSVCCQKIETNQFYVF